MLNAPTWFYVGLILVAIAGLTYGFRPRSEIEKATDNQLSDETVLKLAELKTQRRKDLFSFMDRNAMSIYFLIAFGMFWILKPLFVGD